MGKERDPTYWVDEDRHELPRYNPSQKIECFAELVHNVVFRPLDQIVSSDAILDQPESSALLIVAVAICHGMEAVGRFILDDQDERANLRRFQAFAQHMSDEMKLGRLHGATFAELIWRNFRNGICHGFAVKRGGFVRESTGPYFRIDHVEGREVLMVNPHRFFADFKDGFEKYVGALRKAGPGDPLLVNFLRRFNEIFIKRR
jgi:hypothetical protein